MGGIDPKDLVNSAQIAERLSLKHSESVHTWRRRYPDFPGPVYEHGQVMLWLWSEVRAWAVSTGRLDAAAE